MTMSDKKCKMCGANAEWKLDGDCYCEWCVCTELNVKWRDVPLRCEMCGNTLDRIYYTDGEYNAFCSAKCALEHNDACEIGKEQEGVEGDDGGRKEVRV